MNAITAAVTAAKSTIDRLLSSGNASARSGLIWVEDAHHTWHYAEPFSGPELNVEYRYSGKAWIYTVTNDNADSAFFSKTGAAARTLREARLEALATVEAALGTIDADPQPLEVDSGGNLLNGHLREKAAKMLGITDKATYKVVSGDENNAGCLAQDGKAENGAKKELLKMVSHGNHLQAIQAAFDFDLIPQQWLHR